MTIIEPQAARAFSIEIVRKLRAAGYESYWAGGCVRDQLLGREPKDYDVATNANPDQIRDLFGQRRTLALGAAFGVISVLGPKRAGPVEVATFRRDGAYSDGRHPDSVQFTTAEEDAQRRDFTINGMFLDPIEDRVIDFVGGAEDLRGKVIRAIRDPRERFDEDKLRMLRAVRFAASLEFSIDPETVQAVREGAAQISVVSGERIAQELRRMFVHMNRRQSLELLFETTLFGHVFPALDRQADSASWRTETLHSVGSLQTASLPLVLAVLHQQAFAAQGRSVVESMGAGLKLSRDDIATVLAALENEPLIRSAADPVWLAVQRILTLDRVESILDFAGAIAAQTGEGAEGVAFCRAKMALPESEWNPPPIIDGADLHRLGVHAGPIFRQIIDAVRDRQLQGELQSKPAALTWLREHFQV